MRWTIRTSARPPRRPRTRVAITGRVVDSYTNIHSVKLFAHTDGEDTYAHEAIETARQTFRREMRIITRMDIGLTALNGALIVAVIGSP